MTFEKRLKSLHALLNSLQGHHVHKDACSLVHDITFVVNSTTGLYDEEIVCKDFLDRLCSIYPEGSTVSREELGNEDALWIVLRVLKEFKSAVFDLLNTHQRLANTQVLHVFILENLRCHENFFTLQVGSHAPLFSERSYFLDTNVHGDKYLDIISYMIKNFFYYNMVTMSIDIANCFFHDDSEKTCSVGKQREFIQYAINHQQEHLYELVPLIRNSKISLAEKHSIFSNSPFIEHAPKASLSVLLDKKAIKCIDEFFCTYTCSTAILCNYAMANIHTKQSSPNDSFILVDLSLVLITYTNPYLTYEDVHRLQQAIMLRTVPSRVIEKINDYQVKGYGLNLFTRSSIFSKGHEPLRNTR